MRVSERKATIVNRKFFEYLVPTVLSIIAVSLNEFVDGILVSHLLGNEAMGYVHLAFPIMLIFAMVHTFLGVGGSIIYAECSGKQESDKARIIFSVTMILSVLFSVVFLIAGLVFINQIVQLLHAPEEAQGVFLSYVRRLIISGIFIIPLQTLIVFSPALGAPRLGSAVNIVANVVNLVMDYVYIRFAGMHVEGAATATMTGYIVGLAVVVTAVSMRKMPFPFALPKLRDYKTAPAIIMRGLPPSVTQLGYCIKLYFCNLLAQQAGGFVAVRIFALCIQTVSIASIAIGGIVGAMVPIAASLYGQRDFNGIKILLDTVLRVQLIANVVLVVLFEVFPRGLMDLYNGSTLPYQDTVFAIRIFSILFIFRGFSVVFMYYYQVVQRKIYANIISLVDGFIGIIPVSLLMVGMIGIHGLWAAYPMVAILLDAGILVANIIIVINSKGRYRNILLFEEEDKNVPVYDVTFTADDNQIVKTTTDLEAFCKENNVSDSAALFAGIISEEISVITRDNKDKKGTDKIDMLVKIYPDYLLFDFRNIGKPLDVSQEVCKGSNIDVLKKISYSADFSYVMGMNLTRIKLMR